MAHSFRMLSPYCVSAASIIVWTARIPFVWRSGQPECSWHDRSTAQFSIFVRLGQIRREINFHSKGNLQWPTSH